MSLALPFPSACTHRNSPICISDTYPFSFTPGALLDFPRSQNTSPRPTHIHPFRAPAPRPNSLPGHLGGVFLPRGVTLVPHSEGIALLGLVSKTQQLYPSGLKNAPFEAPSSENHARSGHVGGVRIVMGEKLDLRIKRSASARCRAQGGSADSWTSGFPVTRPPQTSRARSLPVSAARLPTR